MTTALRGGRVSEEAERIATVMTHFRQLACSSILALHLKPTATVKTV
jgi:hypothetical protein